VVRGHGDEFLELLAWDGRDQEGCGSPLGVDIAKVRQGDQVRRSRALLLLVR
jgi:hypothetical protein